MNKILFTAIVAVSGMMLFALAQKPVLAQGTSSGWDTTARIVDRIKAPVFPSQDFPITSFGAVAGGTQDNTEAIQKAIDTCSKAGGGRVVVPSGVFLTGGLKLKSNVNLYLSDNATLRFSTNPKAYLPVVFTRWEGIECMNFAALIYAYGQENIGVTGKGTLDGGASDENWWAWKKISGPDAKLQNELADKNVPAEKRIFGDGHYLRPNFFQPYKCKNVIVEGVTFARSPMWEVHPALCTNVIVRGLIINSHGPNNDGCDPESSKDVLIENCIFDTGDDCIAIKSGRNDDGRRVGVPSENIIIRNCTMKDGHGGVSLGSECSGGIRNIYIENCNMDSPNLDRAIRLKNNAKRGGIIENVYMRNVKIGRVTEGIITVDFMYEEGPNGKFMPVLRNVYLENITSKTSPRIFFLKGFKGASIDGIHLRNCTFEGANASEIIQFAGLIELNNVTVIPEKAVESLSTRPSTVDDPKK